MDKRDKLTPTLREYLDNNIKDSKLNVCYRELNAIHDAITKATTLENKPEVEYALYLIDELRKLKL